MPTSEAVAVQDFEILIEVDRVLQRADYSALRGVAFAVTDGCVVLEGTLPSYFLKQIAQSMVAEVAKSHPIENRIEVRQGNRPSVHRPRRIHLHENAIA